jgi:hypothetical protein
LTVVIPTFNERDNIGPLVELLDTVLRDVNLGGIFVDYDSPDGTAERIREISRRDRRVRCLQRIGRRASRRPASKGPYGGRFSRGLCGAFPDRDSRFFWISWHHRRGRYESARCPASFANGSTARANSLCDLRPRHGRECRHRRLHLFQERDLVARRPCRRRRRIGLELRRLFSLHVVTKIRIGSEALSFSASRLELS